MSEDSRAEEFLSVIPNTGHFEEFWPAFFNLPQGKQGKLSSAGWTRDNEGYIQQTFLGASIRSFNINAGFGDTSSTLSVALVEDEYNRSDKSVFGIGDDVYHSGIADRFAPPIVGSPVFFKFGKNWATVEQAWLRFLDESYFNETEQAVREGWYDRATPPTLPEVAQSGDFNRVPFPLLDNLPLSKNEYVYASGTNEGTDNEVRYWQDREKLFQLEDLENGETRGYDHIVFGGILQSYVKNRGPNGGPLYELQVVDPREILSNVQLIFKNYADTTFNNQNMINVYGFLEYDPSDKLKEQLEAQCFDKWIFTKHVHASGDNIGKVEYRGESEYTKRNSDLLDVYEFKDFIKGLKFGQPLDTIKPDDILPEPMPRYFPITGEGYARVSELGIPYYRVSQALAALWEQYGQLPKEYKDAGFGGEIDFRGFNYLVDFRGFPEYKIPSTYFFDFDQMDLLSFCQEMCEIISHDLVVTLHPIVKHPAYKFLHSKNLYYIERGEYDKIVHGIIKIDAIDRSKQPEYGKIQEYISELQNQNIYVENQDVGFELSNVVTDKLVAGAQEVNMYFFSTHYDRDTLEYRKKMLGGDNKHQEVIDNQWSLATSLKQQVLPFYGFLGKEAVTIPRGFGSYQQIMLDMSELDAVGIDNYYVATEMELRCASISYESWRDFLLNYNDLYIEELTEGKAFYDSLAQTDIQGVGDIPDSFGLGNLTGREFGVSVPRSVFNSERGFKITRQETSSEANSLYNPKDLSFLSAVSTPADAIYSESNLPKSPCNPPYGYPLYYKRAERIGIPEAGIVKFNNTYSSVYQKIQDIRESYDTNRIEGVIDPTQPITGPSTPDFPTDSVENPSLYHDQDYADQTKCSLDKMSQIQKDIELLGDKVKDSQGQINIAFLDNLLERGEYLYKNVNKIARRGEKNARKIHQVLKKIADENLGKKFLVKIPKYANNHYNSVMSLRPHSYLEVTQSDDPEVPPIAVVTPITNDVFDFAYAPFGFKDRPVDNHGKNYLTNPDWIEKHSKRMQSEIQRLKNNPYQSFLYLGKDEKKVIIKTPPIDLTDEDIISQYPDNANVILLNNEFKTSDGALKTNWNPVSEKWEFNFKPEPQGGFFDFNLFPRNLGTQDLHRSRVNKELGLNETDEAVPPIVINQLAPRDLTNFLNDNGRVSAYVRFNDSQFLDFSQVGPNNVYQEIITRKGLVPDIMDDIDNINPDEAGSFGAARERLIFMKQDGEYRKERAVAYVKCEVDEKLYMAPKILFNEDELILPYETGRLVPQTHVYAREVKWRPSFSKPELIQYTNDAGEQAVGCAQLNTPPLFEIDDTLGLGLGGVGEGKLVRNEDFLRRFDYELYKRTNYKDQCWKIVTEREELDPEHVWALITLPGKIKPTEEKRFVDANKTFLNGQSIKKILTQDVVRGPEGFEKPPEIKNEAILNCRNDGFDRFSFKELNQAQRAQREAQEDYTLASPELTVNFAAPSPVYPDIVAIPLMSNERCYGPWYSSFFYPQDAEIGGGKLLPTKSRYVDVGGKAEFIKDENLAPWNYAGFQLMNDAGKLQAEFSNSLLMFTERGGFVFPGLPSGLFMSKELKEKGPIVTSVSVEVGDTVKSTVKLDLYTARFGKLQKQKEIAISQMARERQKIIDDRNKAIRSGNRSLATAGEFINPQSQQVFDYYTSLERGQTVYDGLYSSVNKKRQPYRLDDGTIINVDKFYLQSSTQANGYINEVLSNVTDTALQRIKYLGTAGGNYNTMFHGADDAPFSTLLPHKDFVDTDSIIRRTT